jgi:hypothetical protein
MDKRIAAQHLLYLTTPLYIDFETIFVQETIGAAARQGGMDTLVFSFTIKAKSGAFALHPIENQS